MDQKVGPVGWGGWLFQTRPIPRSPDGDNNVTKAKKEKQDVDCTRLCRSHVVQYSIRYSAVIIYDIIYNIRESILRYLRRYSADMFLFAFSFQALHTAGSWR